MRRWRGGTGDGNGGGGTHGGVGGGERLLVNFVPIISRKNTMVSIILRKEYHIFFQQFYALSSQLIAAIFRSFVYIKISSNLTKLNEEFLCSGTGKISVGSLHLIPLGLSVKNILLRKTFVPQTISFFPHLKKKITSHQLKPRCSFSPTFQTS